jgi:hypothetical protein
MNTTHRTPRRQQYRNLSRWFTHPGSTRARRSDWRLRAARKRGSRLLVGGLLPACAVVASVALVTVPSANVTARAGTAAAHPDASPAHTLHLTSHIVASHRVGTRGLVAFAKDYSGGRLVDFEVVDVVSANSADVSFGLFRGFLYGTVTINHATGKLSGQVTGGSGAYQGDRNHHRPRPAPRRDPHRDLPPLSRSRSDGYRVMPVTGVNFPSSMVTGPDARATIGNRQRAAPTRCRPLTAEYHAPRRQTRATGACQACPGHRCHRAARQHDHGRATRHQELRPRPSPRLRACRPEPVNLRSATGHNSMTRSRAESAGSGGQD